MVSPLPTLTMRTYHDRAEFIHRLRTCATLTGDATSTASSPTAMRRSHSGRSRPSTATSAPCSVATGATEITSTYSSRSIRPPPSGADLEAAIAEKHRQDFGANE
jgi:hypothetical protein